MTTRTEMLIPEGWKVKPGARVGLLKTKDDPSPAWGAWRVIDRAPNDACWWIQPASDSARTWADTFPNAMVQGCLQVPAKQLVPPSLAGSSTGGRS